MLAQMIRRLAPPQYVVHGFDLPEFDLTEPAVVDAALTRVNPAVIINCAAFTQVDDCETQVDLAFKVNGEGPGFLAATARDLGATLVQVSTDYVFPGTNRVPYHEDDPTGPASVYGRSKLAGEAAVAVSGLERFFTVRTSWLYGPGGRNFVETMVRLGREREALRVVADQFGSPTYTGDLAQAIFNLLDLEDSAERGAYGLYHFSDDGVCSWHGFAEAILAEARKAGEPIIAQRVVPIATDDYPLPAPRPAWSVLAKDKYRRATGAGVPAWPESLAHYFRCDRS
jgi:dTDP-4-dehydrorhamnose reductase